MRYRKSLLLIVIRYKIDIAKISCARCAVSTAWWMHRHHIISGHTARLILRNAVTYGERVAERYRNKSH